MRFARKMFALDRNKHGVVVRLDGALQGALDGREFDDGGSSLLRRGGDRHDDSFAWSLQSILVRGGVP